MKSMVRGAWLFVLALASTAPQPAAAQTSLSVYADGRVVVRRVLAQALPRGRTELRLVLEGLDPATLFSPDTAVTVLRAVAEPPTDRQSALGAAVGRTLAFVRAKDTVRAMVVRVNPPQYRLVDGRLLLELPGEPLFPAELVRTAPEGRIVIEASRARPRTELAYVTEGVTWEATYQVFLVGRQAVIGGTATISSQGFNVEDAEVQLVAGSIRRARGPGPPARPLFSLQAKERGYAAEETPEEVVGETHVYTLPGRVALVAGVPVAAALFPRAAAGYEREYVVPGGLPLRGAVGGGPGEADRQPVQVWYTLRRPRTGAFGERPLPAGTMQLYEPDSDGRVQLVGEASIGHTPAGANVRAQVSDAFDLTAERVQTDYKVEDVPPARRGMPTRRRYTAAFRVLLKSAMAAGVTVDVHERRAGEWRVVESSVPPDKLSAAAVRFRVAVPANGESVLTYTVEVVS